MISLFVRQLAQNLSDMGGLPAASCRRHSHFDTQYTLIILTSNNVMTKTQILIEVRKNLC
jgi:hypothetical protein